MMLRMWHGTTARDKADRYERFLVGRAIPDYRSVPGNLDASILRRDEGDLSHFLTITHWISEDAIRAFAGSEVLKAKYYLEDEDYLLEFEPSVQHYGVVATEHAPGSRLLAPPRLPGAIPGEPSLNRAVPDPFEFGRHWLEAWNAHDLEALLAHFDEAVVFTSPVAAQLLTGSEGVIRGKGALRAYWTEALRRIPDLRFDLIGVYAGVRSLVINFRNQKGGLANEVLIFDQGLVTEGHGTYLDRGGNLAGASE